MRAQAQFTIHTLNDVVTGTTAPASPYKGQLWVNTSYSPPRTFVYSGSAWKEQNGTDTLRSNISTLTTKSNTMQSNLDGLTSTVSSVTKRVETVENDIEVVEENILDIQTDVSELEQTASSIALRVTANETDISALEVTASGLSTRVTNTEGKVTTLTTTVNGLKTRVTNTEGDISTLEQNVSSITTRITNAEGDITELTTDISGLTTRVSNAEGKVTTLTTSVNGLSTRVSNAEGDISALEQTASSLSASISGKISAEGGSTSSFGWKLTSSGFYLYSSSVTVMSVTSSGLTVTGAINANSGTIGNLTINGRLYFGGDSGYFIDPNYNDGSYYVYLPGLRIDDGSGAVFSGNLSAPSGTIGGFTIGASSIYKTKTSYSSSTAGVYVGTDGIGLGAGTFYVSSAGALTAKSGTIGGFTIGTSSIYKTKTAYSNTTAGVYLGTDGIGLGAGTFYVTSAGALTASSATITGAITATSGSIKNMTISGRLYFGNNSSYYIDANYSDTSYYINLPGFRVDDASGAVFSGKLSAASGSFSGTITATGGKIGSLNISDGGLLYGTVSTDNVATGVKINTLGIWAKEGHFSTGSFGYWFLSSSGYFWALYNRSWDIYLKSTGPTVNTSSASWVSIITTANSSSDARIKKDIEPLSAKYEDFFDNLTPRRFRYIDGTSGRYHTGFVAQEVVTALQNAELDTQQFAGAVLWFPGSEDECWHLRKDEFVALNTWEIQKLKKRILALEAALGLRKGE